MLTQDMNNIANWLDKNKLIINLKKDKTESMLSGTGQRLSKENANPFSVKIRDQSICYLTSYKYLGITLDPMLTLSHHLLNTYRKVLRETSSVKKDAIINYPICKINISVVNSYSIFLL